MLRRETLVCDTIEDETGIANLIVWAAILERFRRTALGGILCTCDAPQSSSKTPSEKNVTCPL